MQSSAKLTLSLDKDIIARAKKYADKRGKSVSKIVQDYLASIATADSTAGETTPGPITRELHGVLKGKIPADYKLDIADYIEEKYK